MKELSMSIQKRTRAEAEQLLAAELNKPAADMDVALVDELLAFLEPEEPSPGQRARAWRRLCMARLTENLGRLGLAAACAVAAVVLVLSGMRSSAKAFDWRVFRAWFSPAAEVYRLTSEQAAETVTTPTGDPRRAWYTSLAELPREVDGWPLRPAWLPEGCSLDSGMIFADSGMTKADLSFTCGEGCFSVSLTVLASGGAVSVAYEKEPEDGFVQEIGGCLVRVFANAEDRVLTAAWQADNASYSVCGDLTRDELLRIVRGLIP